MIMNKKTIAIVMVVIVMGIVAVAYYNNYEKESKITERKAMLEDFGYSADEISGLEDDEKFMKALESIDEITLSKLDEENHERIEYGINHMPMLKKIHIVFRDLGNKEDNSIDLEYFYDFDLKDKNIEVDLGRVDDKSLTPLKSIGHISKMTVLGFNMNTGPIDFKGLDNVSELELENEVIDENSHIGDMINLEKLTLKDVKLNGFGDLSNLKKLDNITLTYTLSDNQLEQSGFMNSVSGLETLDHDIYFYSNAKINQNIVDGLEKVKLSTLEINNHSALDLSTLKECKKIKLNSDDPITNETVANISHMDGLQELDLSGDIQVDDYSVLNSLQTLDTLSINQNEENQLNLGTMPQLTNIKSLFLYGDKADCVSDISDLGKMYWLEELYIIWQTVPDISALSNMSGLKILKIPGANVSDISVLSNMPNLEVLDISGTNVMDISVLANIPTLEQLNLAGTEIADLSVLPQLNNLKTLSLASMDLSDASVLSSLKNLEVLNLQNSSISDYSFLADLTNLKELNLEGSSISNLDAVAGMNDLENLNISGCKIKDISALEGKEKLTYLDISETDVDDISALDKCKELVSLDISDTAVNDFTALKDASKLKTIKAENTNIKVKDWLPVRDVDNIIPYYQQW